MKKGNQPYPYDTIGELIANNSYQEDISTCLLLHRCKKKLSEFEPELISDICVWKAARAAHHFEGNDHSYVRYVLKYAGETKDGIMKAHILTAIKGIQLPTASAILMFSCPEKYPVIDTRVWQLLHDMGEVTANQNGVAFSLSQWEEYLNIISLYAKKYKLTARQVEKRLFDVHRRFRKSKRMS